MTVQHDGIDLHRRLPCVAAVALTALVSGCITVYGGAPPAGHASGTVGSASQAIEQPGVQEKDLTISDAIQICKEVQESEEIPIHCSTTYFEGAPSMLVGFENRSTASEYWGAMTEYVAGPFCAAANGVNRVAFVFMVLSEGELARVFACEKGEWSDWFPYGERSDEHAF